MDGKKHGFISITPVAPASSPIPTSNITFTILKEKYKDSGITSATGHANLMIDTLYSFTSHTFTNCGITGHTGPDLDDCKNTYGANIEPWNNTDYFNVGGKPGVNGIQIWTVPDTGYYEVDAYGARGGGILGVPGSNDAGGGLGARMKSRFSLTIGDKYMILCGQQGGAGANSGLGSSGGGGTFFVKGDDYSNITLADLQLAAGGGGGRGSTGHSSTSHGQPGQSGTSNSTSGGSTGTYGVGGGGGLISNGDGNGYIPASFTGGYSFKNGGEGGTPGNYSTVAGQYGGFGGGGGASVHSGSGAGGVYGGDSANPYNSNPNGKGGGSHYKGTILVSTTGQNDGHGKIIITATSSSGTPRSVLPPTIYLSYFRNATFTSGSAVPSSGAISINTDFKGKTFGSSSSGGGGGTSTTYEFNATHIPNQSGTYGGAVRGLWFKNTTGSAMTITEIFIPTNNSGDQSIWVGNLGASAPANYSSTSTASTAEMVKNYTGTWWTVPNSGLTVANNHHVGILGKRSTNSYGGYGGSTITFPSNHNITIYRFIHQGHLYNTNYSATSLPVSNNNGSNTNSAIGRIFFKYTL